MKNIVVVAGGVSFTTNHPREIWPTMQMLVAMGYVPEITNVSWGTL